MPVLRPRFPLAVRVMNRVGGALRAVGLPLVRLDETSLMEEAARATGLSDFGDERFRDPLRRLLAAYEGEAALTPLGRIIARREAVQFLSNRLRMTAERRRHPEIDDGEVRAPVFIIGLPRTGTSILHELLAEDRQSRVPMTWEAMHPWPPPERATYETDPRIAEVEKHYAGIDRLLPDFKRMHPMGARLPQECVALMAHDFASMLFHVPYDVPSYQAWLDAADMRWVYASHRRQLQYLQWRCPAARWVLKSPCHLWHLEALLAVYPDARLVHTHRDPLKVTASLASLTTTLRSLASDRVDTHAIAADWTARLARGLDHAMAVRAREGVDGRVVDVQFGDFMRDQIGTVRRIYERFDMALSPEAAERMCRFLAANPHDKHGAHRYTLAEAGLDPDAERRRFAAYQARYAVPSEPVV
jgi:hypothetical protein